MQVQCFYINKDIWGSEYAPSHGIVAFIPLSVVLIVLVDLSCIDDALVHQSDCCDTVALAKGKV